MLLTNLNLEVKLKGRLKCGQIPFVDVILASGRLDNVNS